MHNQTLQVSKAYGQILVLALPVLLLLLILMEVLIRQPFVQSYLNTPTLNGQHRHLDRQWHRLKNLAKSGVDIQCIALGNSMVQNSFDPQIFKRHFQNLSAKAFDCFNFGVDGLTPVSAAALAQILSEIYQPELLIIGVDARDLAVDPESDESRVVTDMKWIQYRLGHFNLEGWAVDHSYLYRYRRTFIDLLQLNFEQRSDSIAQQYGYEPLDVTAGITTPPDLQDESFHIQYYYRILGQYSIHTENVDAFEHILAQKTHRTIVIVVEMPVPETYFSFFDEPQINYEMFLDTISEVTANNQVPFIKTTQHNLIPEDGWADYSHVNRKGASLFSEWLGKRMAQVYLADHLPDGKLTDEITVKGQQ